MTKGDKWIALQKYKTLRNRVTNQIRNDAITTNGKRIDEAKSESEYWKVINDINKPNSVPKYKLDDGVSVTENEEDSDLESTPKNNQVFQKEDPALAVTLQEIMKKLEDMNNWQKEHQKQSCSQNSSQKNWRQSPERELVSMTQEQKARWESQDRAMSQRDSQIRDH